MVKIRLGQHTATVQDQHWTSTSPTIADTLNLMHSEGAPTAAPDGDLYLALDAIAQVGGKIVEHVPAQPGQAGPGVIY